MYPCIFNSSLPSSCHSESDQESFSDDSSQYKNTFKKLSFDNSTINPDLIITSEGLCDHVRELFSLNRHEFNIYQVKAMRKLLSSQSHQQIIKEELMRQHFIVENNQHPYYKREKFQSELSYSTWKDRCLASLNNIMKNFENIYINNKVLKNEEVKQKYIFRLNLFPTYYESLVSLVFKNLALNESAYNFKMTNNSKRLLKEFQMRYCVV